MKTYFVRVFGCAMNSADAERIAAVCRDAGWSEAASEDDADAVIFVTCSVRQKGEDRVRGLVATTARVRSAQHLVLTGCMMHHGEETIRRAMPALSLAFQISEPERLGSFLRDPGAPPRPAARPGTKARLQVPASGSSAKMPTASAAPRFTADDVALGRAFSIPPLRRETWRAWVPIGSGCDEFCSYCVVPLARGKEWWRSMDDIVAEVRAAVDAGAREVVLLGQNVNAYGRVGGRKNLIPPPRRGVALLRPGLGGGSSAGLPDVSKDGTSPEDPLPEPSFPKGEGEMEDSKFVQLLRAASEVDGDFVLRFTSPHPAQMGDDFVRFFREAKKLAPNLHLPLQSGSTRILERMNRSHTLPGFRELIGKLRAARPDTTFTADLIVGFPGETEAEFEESLAALREFRFLQVFAARFSPRVGTAAARMPDDVPPEEKKRRWDAIQAVQREVSALHYSSLVGQTLPVLFDKVARGMVSGRTPGMELISVDAGSAQPGEVLAVRVTGEDDFSARGEVLGSVHFHPGS